jgi:hypothetical protein
VRFFDLLGEWQYTERDTARYNEKRLGTVRTRLGRGGGSVRRQAEAIFERLRSPYSAQARRDRERLEGKIG